MPNEGFFFIFYFIILNIINYKLKPKTKNKTATELIWHMQRELCLQRSVREYIELFSSSSSSFY